MAICLLVHDLLWPNEEWRRLMDVFWLCLGPCWRGALCSASFAQFFSVAHTHSHLTSLCDILHWTDVLGKVHF